MLYREERKISFRLEKETFTLSFAKILGFTRWMFTLGMKSKVQKGLQCGKVDVFMGLKGGQRGRAALGKE